MDNRLIPPSHFDPQEEDSLEETSIKNGASSIYHTPRVTSGIHLRPPDDFASPAAKVLSGHNASVIHIGKPVIHIGQHQTPSNVFRSQGFSSVSKPERPALERNGNEMHKYAELLRLQAENEALKSIIHNKKENLNNQESTMSEEFRNRTHEAVIEHQTQHIARLQREIDAQNIALTKREAEVSQYESAVANKEREAKKLAGSVELLEVQLRKKNEEEKLLQQEIEDLRVIIGNLKIEKDEFSQKLKNEKHENETNLNIKMDEFAKLQEVGKREWLEKISELEGQQKIKIQELKDCHLEELDGMAKARSECQLNYNNEVAAMATDLDDVRKKLERATESLNEEKSQNEALKNKIVSLKSAIEESKLAHEKEKDRISHLQTYIGEQQKEDYQRSQWKKQKKQLEDSIVALQTERENFIKTQELQNIRLQSITKILSTQEEAIHANAKAFSSGNVKGDPGHVVIRRWREKVFELMMQCKSNEIISRETENKYRQVENDLKERLDEERRVSVIFENQLSECKAQLEMQENNYESLSKSHRQLSEKFQEKAKSVSELEETVVTISESISKATKQLYDEFQNKFTALVEKTIHQEQRILFANNRLRTIHDLLVRRDNVWRAKLKQIKEQKLEVDNSGTARDEEITPRIERPDLVAEIEQLTRERDALSRKLSSDSTAFDVATSKFTERESELAKKILALQHDLQQKSEEFAELKASHDCLDEKLNDFERTALDATNLAKTTKNSVEKEIELKLEEAWKTWDSEKRELEKRLEASQREHARTVITSRQSERNAVREKKRATENLQAIVEECRSEAERLQTKIKTLKQDNNLLMTTLRQQGLLSTFKAARAKAKVLLIENGGMSSDPASSKKHLNEHLHCALNGQNLTIIENTPMPLRQYRGECTSDSEPNSKPVTDGAEENNNVDEMLKDLVVLTENILDESD